MMTSKKEMKEFERLHPLALMLCFADILLISMFVMNPFISLISLAGAVFLCLYYHGLRQTVKKMSVYFFIIVLAVLTNPLFSHNGVTALFYVNGNAITLESLYYGLGMGLMLVSVLAWCSIMSEIFTGEKILYLIGKAFPQLALVLSIALRFIPLFIREMKKIRDTQICLGAYENKGTLGKLERELEVFKSLAGQSIEKSIDTAASMNARGYGIRKRTAYSDYSFTKRDFFFLTLNFCAIFFTFIGIYLGRADFYYYPAVFYREPDIITALMGIAFMLACFEPLLLEIGENIRWKLLIQKI